MERNFIESLGKIVPFIAKVNDKEVKFIEEPVYKGNKNETEFPEFIQLCKLTQEELKVFLVEKLIEKGYTDIVTGDGYVYAKGNFPVLLTAHMDTVHKETVKDFYEETTEYGEHIITSPQGIGGDDRCGIYMILEIIKEHKCSVLFCEDEEIGRVGARKFVETEFIEDLKQMKYLIELDRKGSTDAVFYQCDNPDFTKFITENTGYKKEHGSYSDISTLAPACGVAAVNFSCGYYKAHRTEEEVHVEEMLDTIDAVKMLLEVECEQFEYVERKYTYEYGNYGGYHYGSGYHGFDSFSDYVKAYYRKHEDLDSFCDVYFENRYEDEIEEKEDYNDKFEGYCSSITLTVLYLLDDDHNGTTVTVEGSTKAEAWMNFFMEYPTVCYNNVIDWDYDYKF